VRHNRTFNVSDVFVLVTPPALLQITSHRWQATTNHIIKEEGRMWELHGLTSIMVSQLVINTGDAETSSDKEPLCSDMNTDMESIHPLPNSSYVITDISK
jgi:hypothetical protein